MKLKYLLLVVAVFTMSLVSGCIEITNDAILPNGYIVDNLTINYKVAIKTKGSLEKYQYDIIKGSLPSGLTIDINSGVISGIISALHGKYVFTVNVQNVKNKSENDAKEFTINVREKYPWTIIVHMAVDNDFDYSLSDPNNIKLKLLGIGPIIDDALNTLIDIKKNDKLDNIQILILMDVFKNKNYSDGYYSISGGESPILNKIKEASIEHPEINSGNKDDVNKFINWAVNENAPSEHYVYSVFNHGRGYYKERITGETTWKDHGGQSEFLGIALDKNATLNSVEEYLTLKEFNDSMIYMNQKINKKIDLIFLKLCTAGGLETAYELRNNADYIVFSEDVLPIWSWSFEGLDEINNNPSVNAEDIGKAICTTSLKAYKNSGLAYPFISQEFTLSLIKLSLIDDLFNAINLYAEEASIDIFNNSNAPCYNSAADSSYSMAGSRGTEFDNYMYIDLGDYLENIIDPNYTCIPSNVKELANSAKAVLKASVIQNSNYRFLKDEDNDNPTGMYIFHNIWNAGKNSDGIEYYFYYEPLRYSQCTAFGAQNAWTDYLSKLDSARP